MKELFPNMNSCTFIFECSRGGGRLPGAFPEQSIASCTYCGELLGLLAIHLILLSINRVTPNLPGSVLIYSDCLGVLDKVKNLPPHQIPAKCRHSDVLKNIMIHCSTLTFDHLFSHVLAHQDDSEEFDKVSCQAQLNARLTLGPNACFYSSHQTSSPDNNHSHLRLLACGPARRR
jgi:hypothetical protein